MDMKDVTTALKDGVGHILREFDARPSYEQKLYYVNAMPETISLIVKIFADVERCLREELRKITAAMEAQEELRH